MNEPNPSALVAEHEPPAEPENPRRVRVHQETGRDSRIYSLEFFDGGRSWREPLWSVTTLLGSIDKPALPRWAAGAVADYVLEHAGYLAQDLARFGPAETKRRLAEAPYLSKSRAGDIGTAVHAQVDAHITGAARPPVPEDIAAEVAPRFEQFLRFEREWRPRYHGAEVTVVNPEHGWAGTLDSLAEIGTRGLGLIDMKCTKPKGRDGAPGVYAEHPLQIAAYAHGREIVPARGVWTEPVPMPEVHWGAVLWLHTDRYELVEVDIGEHVYRAFLVAAELHRYMDGPSKRSILGVRASSQFGVPPVEATAEEAAAVQTFALGAGAAAPAERPPAAAQPAGGAADLDADPGPERPPEGGSGSPVADGAPDGGVEDAPRYANEAQRKRLLKIASIAGATHADVKKYLASRTPPITSTTKIPAGRVYDEVVAHFEDPPDAAGAS